jgi:hypothetical protein
LPYIAAFLVAACPRTRCVTTWLGGQQVGFPVRSSCVATSRRCPVALVCSPRVLQHALCTAIRLMHQLLTSKPAASTCKHSVTISSGTTNLVFCCMGSSNATIRRYSVALVGRPRVFTHALCASYHLYYHLLSLTPAACPRKRSVTTWLGIQKRVSHCAVVALQPVEDSQ